MTDALALLAAIVEDSGIASYLDGNAKGLLLPPDSAYLLVTIGLLREAHALVNQ